MIWYCEYIKAKIWENLSKLDEEGFNSKRIQNLEGDIGVYKFYCSSFDSFLSQVEKRRELMNNTTNETIKQ
jgi:hypothetical protein